MIKTVIFDIDNTLYECVGLDKVVTHDVLFPYVFEHFGWSEEEYYTRLDEATDELIGIDGYTGSVRNRLIRYQIMMEHAEQPLVPHVMEMYDLYWTGMLERMVPYEGAEEVMQALAARGIRIGICSDLTARIQYYKLTKLGLLPYIDFIVTSEEAGQEKPSSLMFDRALAKARAKAEECIFVGDSFEKDIMGARQAGMHPLWMNTQRGASRPDTREISSLREILSWIDLL